MAHNSIIMENAYTLHKLRNEESAMPNPFNSPPRGSLNWGADRIRRLLDQEERERGKSAAGTRGSANHRSSDGQAAYSYEDALSDLLAGRHHEYLDYISSRASSSEAVASQLPGRERGPADAYRHILWAAEMARRFGENRAREILELHEQDGDAYGQPPDERAMDSSNNEVGIQLGMAARTYDDVIRAARKVISGSVPNGEGAWKPDYDLTSTMAPFAASWLPESRWAKNPREDAPPRSRVRYSPLPPRELRTSETNWYSNPDHPSGPDWQGGYVPDNYVYRFGDAGHATGPQDREVLRARDAYKFLVEHPWLNPFRSAQ